ncbi:MAG: alpha/beta hydrolase, partial [Myxococcota bacterium]
MALPRDDLAPLQGPYPDWFKAAFEVPRSEGSVEVDGCAIHYFEWGERSAPPVLMTHGFMAHARVFAFVAPFLASRFHLVSYD